MNGPSILINMAPWLLLVVFWLFMLWKVRQGRRSAAAAITSTGITPAGGPEVSWTEVVRALEKPGCFVFELQSGRRLLLSKESQTSVRMVRGQLRSALGQRAQLRE